MQRTIEQRFGGRIVELRKERGWTQEYLCERTGIGREHISRLENGRKEAGLAVIGILAKAFRIEVSELMRGV